MTKVENLKKCLIWFKWSNVLEKNFSLIQFFLLLLLLYYTLISKKMFSA